MKIDARIIVRLVSALAGMGATILTAVYLHRVAYDIIVALFSCALGIQIEIILNQRERLAETDRLATLYRSLRQSKCPLIKSLVESKYTETYGFFENLSKGHIPLANETDVDEVLHSLFNEIDVVKEIRATSFGELEEWRDRESWRAKSYAKMHEVAVQQGKRVKRDFILRPDEQTGAADDVLRANVNAKIAVRIAAQQSVSPQDFNQANNCLIFYNRHKKPIYCIQAMHDQQGHFAGAFLYFGSESIQPIVEAYLRIDAIAQAYA